MEVITVTQIASNYAKILYSKESCLGLFLCSHVCVSWLNQLYFELRRLQVQRRRPVRSQKSEISLKAQERRHQRVKTRCSLSH